MGELEKLQEKMHRIKTWVDAYPLDYYPEPDFEEAYNALKQHGMILDFQAITMDASNMRQVLEAIKNIIEGEMDDWESLPTWNATKEK